MKEPHAKSKDKIAQNEEKSKGEVNLTPEEQEKRQRFLAIRQALKDPEKRKEWEVRQYARWLDARVKPEEKKKEESTPRNPTEIEKYYAERLVNSITRRTTANRYFLNLARKRYLWVNPLDLPVDDKRYIFYLSRKGTTAPVYAFLLVKDGKPVDVGLVRTYPTLRKIDAEAKQGGMQILLHPHAIRIPKGFWQEWKKAACMPQDKLRLVRKYKLLTDEAIGTIDKIVLDVDTPFEKAFPKVLRIFQSLGIDKGYEIGRTKSGNLRAVIYLSHTIKAQKDFRKNKHIERLREAYYLLVELFRRHELKLDRTFADRINHPIWFSFDERFYKRESKVDGTVDFFGLYRNIKKWQKEKEIWQVEGMNLTEKFWGYPASKRKRKILIQLPAFLRNELKTTFDEDYKLSLWKKAVKSLYKGKGGRFLNFIMPAVGWAKYLGLDRHEVDRYLESFLSDRDPKKNEKDLRTAWRVARELEFNIPESKHLPKTYDLVEITQKALNYLVEKESARRQELLKEVFLTQKWLCDRVMDWLEKKGLVESFTLNNTGGRPAKVYTLTEKAMELWSMEKTLAIYNNSPEGGVFLEGVGIVAPKTPEKTFSETTSLELLSSSSQPFAKTSSSGTFLNGKPERLKLVFLRKLQDEELLRVRELVRKHETPDGIELILEVSGQRMETELKVSLDILREKLRELGVEIVVPEAVPPPPPAVPPAVPGDVPEEGLEEAFEVVPDLEIVPPPTPVVPKAEVVFEAVHSQNQSKMAPVDRNGAVPKAVPSPDPHRDKARELIAGFCERVRNFGLAVYEVHYQDRLAVYWERGQSSIKVYEVRYKQKDLREIERELRHILGLVLRADRLIAEGYSEDLVFSLILRARDNQGRFSFVDRNGRLEVYIGKELVKIYEKL